VRICAGTVTALAGDVGRLRRDLALEVGGLELQRSIKASAGRWRIDGCAPSTTLVT
jgi:hypothetical protein